MTSLTQDSESFLPTKVIHLLSYHSATALYIRSIKFGEKPRDVNAQH